MQSIYKETVMAGNPVFDVFWFKGHIWLLWLSSRSLCYRQKPLFLFLLFLLLFADHIYLDTYRKSAFFILVLWWYLLFFLYFYLLWFSSVLLVFLKSWFHGHIDLPSCLHARLVMGNDLYVYLFCFVVLWSY